MSRKYLETNGIFDAMNYSIITPTLPEALEELKKRVFDAENSGRRTIIFCEDRLTLMAERAVCLAVGGTFLTSVYTFSRFLASERDLSGTLLSSHGSAIVIRGIIEKNKNDLRLFGKFSSASSADTLYETISLLYSSGVSAEDLACVKSGRHILDDKLHDISVIYSDYVSFLNETGRLDRKMYLCKLPEVIAESSKIRGADVIIFGFQAFSGTTAECVKSCMCTADNTFGIFVGGKPDLYTNEASPLFDGYAKECGGCKLSARAASLSRETDRIRKYIFDPTAFYVSPEPTDKIRIIEAADEEQEAEFIAASIMRLVTEEKVRYGEISVMSGDLQGARCALSRIFSEYGIPYYVDERRALSEHPLSSFLCDFLECVAGRCAPDDVCSFTSSFLFGLDEKQRGIFSNYIVRCANYRGGALKPPREDVCEKLGFKYDTVKEVYDRFIECVNSYFPEKDRSAYTADKWAEKIEGLLEFFDCKRILEDISNDAKAKYPAEADFNSRAYDVVISVLKEAEELGMGAGYTAREFKKLIQSGLSAAKISLIPPKADAVFVGDLSSTFNAGSEVVFAAQLTEDVPSSGSDTCLLTDREIASLEELDVKISPKIEQMNRRRREIAGLNLCAFRSRLYLSFPVLSSGEEKGRSEIISYISALFSYKDGERLVPEILDLSGISLSDAAYMCCKEMPALKALAGSRFSSGVNAALYSVLCEKGLKEKADSALKIRTKENVIRSAKELYTSSEPKKNGAHDTRQSYISPTLLERYFSCPYRNFTERGLKLAERQEGAAGPVDAGNFIHKILENIARKEIDNKIQSEEEAMRLAREQAQALLADPKYSVISETAGGEYIAARLAEEAERVCAGVYRQLAASNFHITGAEKDVYLDLGDKLGIKGRVDRIDIDEDEDMLRVIDYKTGSADADTNKYYAGVKLQLPLYLLAASKNENKRPAGAYYFPANIEYKDENDAKGDFTLSGYMDKSEEVVRSSDKTVAEGERSRYVNAYLNSGRRTSGAMEKEVFSDFLEYSSLIAKNGLTEILDGNIEPSPYDGECAFCKMGGMCGYVRAESDDRKVNKINSSDIAEIVRKEKGEKRSDE